MYEKDGMTFLSEDEYRLEYREVQERRRQRHRASENVKHRI